MSDSWRKHQDDVKAGDRSDYRLERDDVIVKRLPGSVTAFGQERYDEFFNILSRVHISLYSRFMLMYEGSAVHIMVEIALATAGLFSTALYITSTYSYDDSHDVLADIELWLAFFFAADFFIRLAAVGLSYLKTVEGFVDLLAVIPLISSAGDLNIDPLFRVARVNFTVMRLAKTTRILRVLRLVRFVRVYRLMLLLRNNVKQRLMIHVTIGMSIVLLCGGVFQFLEDTFSENLKRAFHDSCFWALQTLTGLGFGQITPTSVASQMLAVMMAFLLWTLVPIHCVSIINLARSVGSCVSHFVPNSKPRQHCILVVLTYCTEQEIDEFFREFFHSGHEPSEFRIAVLGHRPFLEALAPKLIRKPYIQHIDFVAGSVFDDNDLKRCCLNLAAAVFTMTHRVCISQERSQEDDQQTLLAAISIKNVCPEVPLYLQVNSAMLEGHILWKTLSSFPNIQLICIRQLALSLLAQSCACPGMHVLIGNLLQSIDYDPIHYPYDTWQGEYHWGACHSLFPTFFGRFFDGKTFQDSIGLLYDAYGITPIGMIRSGSSGKLEFELNPMKRIIHAGDLVYVIARSSQEATAITGFSLEHTHRFVPKWNHSKQLQKDDLNRNRSAQEAFQMKVCCPTGLSLRSAVQNGTHRRSLSKSSTKPYSRIQFGNHIVIVGFVEEHVFELVWNLRNQIHTADVPVLVAVRDNNICSMPSLASFPSVYVVAGSLQDESFLRHINLVSALHVVLFSNPAHAFDPVVLDFASKSTQQRIINSDLETITNVIAIENFLMRFGRFKASNCVIEFQFRRNLEFVRPNFNVKQKGNVQANFHPDFADAKVHFAEVPQSVAAFSFYYPHIFNVVQAFLYGSPIQSVSDMKAESDEDTSSMIMQLNLIRVPEQMRNQNYSALLQYFSIEHGHLCLGLFRSKSHRKSPIPYIFVSPKLDTMVCDDDHAFVIAPVSSKEPGTLFSVKGKIKAVTSLYKAKIPNLASCIQDLQTDRAASIQVRRHASESSQSLKTQLSAFKKLSRKSTSVLLQGVSQSDVF